MNNTEQNIEEIFVRSFVFSDKQQRYIDLLANSKNRPKILDHINHQLIMIPNLRILSRMAIVSRLLTFLKTKVPQSIATS
jgi:hypothetical protein